MRLIFDVTDEGKDTTVIGLNLYFISLRSLSFDNELWMTQEQKDTVYKDFDKFYRGVPIIIKGSE